MNNFVIRRYSIFFIYNNNVHLFSISDSFGYYYEKKADVYSSITNISSLLAVNSPSGLSSLHTLAVIAK